MQAIDGKESVLFKFIIDQTNDSSFISMALDSRRELQVKKQPITNQSSEKFKIIKSKPLSTDDFTVSSSSSDHEEKSRPPVFGSCPQSDVFIPEFNRNGAWRHQSRLSEDLELKLADKVDRNPNSEFLQNDSEVVFIA